MMKNILAKINLKNKRKIIIIASIFAVPVFIIGKYLTVVNNNVAINVRKPNYTVVFHSNNGEDDTVSQAFVYGTSQRLTANTFNYDGHLFEFWNTMPNGSGTSYNDEQDVNSLSNEDDGTVDLYAQWSTGPLENCSENKICYFGNGDNVVGAMNDQAVVSGVDTMLISSNYSRSGYGFAGWNTKANGSGTKYGPNQVINTGDLSTQGLRLYAMWVPSSGSFQGWKGCGDLNSGDVIALTDNRDGNTYAVAKFVDNQCWMMENLRLDLSDRDLEINGLNTNAPTADFVTAINSGHPASTDTFCTGNNATCADQILHNTNNTNRELTPSYDANNNSSSWYSYGNYYNWYTLTAGHGTYDVSASGASVDGDICPAGWKLPSGYGTSGDYAKLDIAMGGNGQNVKEGTAKAIEASKRWRVFPYNFIYGGEQNGNSAANRGLSASYSTLNSSSSPRTINFWIKDDRAFMNSNTTLKTRGQTVRCIAYEGYKAVGNIHYDANGGSGAMADAIDVDLSVATAASNGFTKPYNAFMGWNTRADGRGVVVTEGGSVAAAASSMDVTDGGTLTLYATWQPRYSLTYDGNGADAGSMASADAPMLPTGNFQFVASNYSKIGYGFAGWSLDSDAGTKLMNGESVVVYGPNERITVNNAFLNNADSTNNITLYAVWIPESSTKTMQSFGATDCGAMNIGEITALKDVRDNNVYSVAKLNDGNCWMSENLRLDPSSVAFDSGNTNSPTVAFVTSASSASSSDSFCYADNSLCNDQVTFNDSAINRNYTASHDSNEAGTSWYSYGVMYNWYTATAGNGSYDMASGSVGGDICPAGWRLPTGGSGGEYATLSNLTPATNAYYPDSGLVKFPNNFNNSGDYSKTKPGGRNSYGRYWSATANNEKSYRLGFNYLQVTPAGAWNKWVGFPVRCIVK